ncbi:MAG: amidohydrolase family protein [Saprospiraceae bacterium]
MINKTITSRLTWLSLSAFFLCIFYTNAFTQTNTIYLTNANIADGRSDQIKAAQTLIIQGGKIIGIQSSSVEIPDDTEVIDLKGRYITPGLIDAHVHIRNLASAKTALMSGITTVRSMGVDHFADVGLRALAASGAVDAPEVIAAGYHVRPTPSEAFFMDHPELSHWIGKEVEGAEKLKIMVEKMISHDVDWIKTNATARAGLAQTDPREPYYNEAELGTMVKTAAKDQVMVAAHAHGDEGGRAAVKANVRSIEHGTYLSETTLKLMAEKGTYLVPTIAVVSDLTMPGGDYDQPLLAVRGRHMLPRVREMAATAYRLGVKIVAATDTGYDPNSTLRLSQELEELSGIGMSPAEVLRAATSTAAALLGQEERIGAIDIGYEADLLVLDQNPLENTGAYHDPLLVINNGKVILNRLIWEKR